MTTSEARSKVDIDLQSIRFISGVDLPGIRIAMVWPDRASDTLMKDAPLSSPLHE
jgi:hypothetical protein